MPWLTAIPDKSVANRAGHFYEYATEAAWLNGNNLEKEEI